MRDDRSKKTATPTAKQRAVRRCAFVASAEITELSTGTRLSARVSELGIDGCYIETLNPFPREPAVQLRILSDQVDFAPQAKAVYFHPNFGPGLAFTAMIPSQRSV